MEADEDAVFRGFLVIREGVCQRVAEGFMEDDGEWHVPFRGEGDGGVDLQPDLRVGRVLAVAEGV